MLTIFAASYVVCAATIVVGFRFFANGGLHARAEDRSMVAAFLASAMFFMLVHIVALYTDATTTSAGNPIGVLWAGFDLMVNIIHFAGVTAFARCRLGRHAQEIHR